MTYCLSNFSMFVLHVDNEQYRWQSVTFVQELKGFATGFYWLGSGY
jgi:hypothetical protein